MKTKLVPLICNHCGAPLSVPEDVRFVTCGHCNTSLAVEHEGDAFFTRRLDQLAETTERIDQKVDDLQAELARGRQADDLARLDEEWADMRKRYLVDTTDGPGSVPKVMDTVHVWVGMAFLSAVAIGIVGAVYSLHLGALSIALVLCVVAALAVIAKVGEINSKARQYESAFQDYQRRRAELGADTVPDVDAT